MRSDLTVEDIYRVVSRAYARAIFEIRLRPGQAFAYAQDEAGSICTPADTGFFAVLQTAIFAEGLKYGLALSRESPYADDMLEILAESYEKCGIDDLKEIGLDGGALAEMTESMEQVRTKFLQPG